MTNSIQKQWWELRFSCADAEELGALLLELGAGGTVILSPRELLCYLQADDTERAHLCDVAETQGATLLSSSAVKDENWTRSCPELWEPLAVGKITIVPCDDDAAPDPNPTRLQIVPGTGFGTGHHATTFMILELMQQPLFAEPPPQTVLDVGTGSGILALAARKLFQARVTGIDIDDMALDNARTNARLNAFDNFDLSTTPIGAVTGSFNLIVANIYAEVLQTLSPDFARLLSPGGALIVSGIMHSLADPLVAHFERNGWSLKERRERDGWVAIIFARAQ